MHNKSVENIQFSKRLADAMTVKGIKLSPTILQRKFNECFDGKKVTSHAVRNWIQGNVLPTQDKLTCLARMLDISSEFLRFGTDTGKIFAIKNDDGTITELTQKQHQFLKRFISLNLIQQQLIIDITSEINFK